ncbi:MAG TPA: amidohydrolase [Bryobacteraceae bacterium]|nr:amidohydrolase [Bryobacteraceae bacterium]
MKISLLSLFVAITMQGLHAATPMAEIQSLTERQSASLLQLYTHLHLNPELPLHEVKTSERIAKELEGAGYTVTRNIGGHGLVGVLKNGDGPVVMVRTDLDGLPVIEETGLSYASQVRSKDSQGREVGVMHACGHDIHMTSFVGTARLLSQLRQHWRGTLLMVGQPAEELSTGSKAMLADGIFKRFPVPNYILALHSDAGLAAGKVRVRIGDALAGTDNLDLTIRGVSGHGAYSYTTKDPIVLASQTVLALQTIVSREIPAVDAAVVTVGSIHGGTKHNIIPDEVRLEMTVRYYSDAIRERILASITRIANGVAMASGVPPNRQPVVKLREAESIPPVYNEPVLTGRVVSSMEGILGKEHVLVADQVMGGEDFGVFGRTPEKLPICLFWLGTVAPEKLSAGAPLPSLHSSRFAPLPGPAIQTGVKAMSTAVLGLFAK